MSAQDGSAQEYERIMAEIRSQLNGDPGHDGALLMEYSKRYRQHPLAREVVREIGRMLFAALPPDASADLEKEVAGVYEPFRSGLADAANRLSSGDASGARHAVEEVIKQFDPHGETCRDDAVSEYRMFRNPYEAALYQKLFKPTKQIRELPYDLARLYQLYGTILVELQDLGAAEIALSRAKRFSPVDPAVLFELGEVFKLQHRWAEYLELSRFALSVSFSAGQAARAYRNLGFYFSEQGNYDAAAACYKKSGLIDEQSITRCTHELMYIEHKTGKPVPASEPAGVDEVLRANGVQVGMTGPIRETIAEIDEDNNVERDIIETVRTGMLERNIFSGEPAQLASLLLSCSGKYRNHPKTSEILRRMSWVTSDQATPDLKAKTCLAITRLAEDSDAGMGFIDELDLSATNPLPEGRVWVSHRKTAAVIAQYDFSDASMTLNQELASAGSEFPPGSIKDAVELLLTYVGELTLAEGKTTPK